MKYRSSGLGLYKRKIMMIVSFHLLTGFVLFKFRLLPITKPGICLSKDIRYSRCSAGHQELKIKNLLRREFKEQNYHKPYGYKTRSCAIRMVLRQYKCATQAKHHSSNKAGPNLLPGFKKVYIFFGLK